LFHHLYVSVGAHMTSTALAPAKPDHESLIGTWRRFGSAGPAYEIIATVPAKPDGTQAMRIRVLESGEEIDYRLTHILADPRAT